jgi:hypothetical protein
MDDLHGRAGKRSWGYVEPAQAAQDLLEEAVAGHLDDMKRRMHLGLDASAESVCAGIVLGLFRASRQNSGGIVVNPENHIGPFGHRRCHSCRQAAADVVPSGLRSDSYLAWDRDAESGNAQVSNRHLGDGTRCSTRFD